MDLTKYPIIIIVVIAAIVVWLMTKLWYDKQKKEGFAPMDTDLFNVPQYKELEAKYWNSRWYYENLKNLSHEELQKENEKLPTKMASHLLQKQQPIPHNIHSGQTVQVAGTENINQMGAPLTEVLEQEVQLVGPMQNMSPELQEIMRQEEAKLYEMKMQGHAQVNKNYSVAPEVQQADIEAMIRGMAELHTKKVSDYKPETEYRHAEVVPEYTHVDNVEPLVYELPHHEAAKHIELVEQELMPGMEKSLEKNMEKKPEPVVIKVKVENNNLALAILLSVILIGFVQNTRDY